MTKFVAITTVALGLIAAAGTAHAASSPDRTYQGLPGWAQSALTPNGD